MLFNLDPIEGLTTRLKVSFYGGFVLALPVVLWQVWRFIVPALHKTEREYAMGFVLSSVILFLFGCVIAFFTLEPALEFMIGWAGQDVDPAFQVAGVHPARRADVPRLRRRLHHPGAARVPRADSRCIAPQTAAACVAIRARGHLLRGGRDHAVG